MATTYGAAALSTCQRSQGSSSKSRFIWNDAVWRIMRAPARPAAREVVRHARVPWGGRSSGASSIELAGSIPTASSVTPSPAAAARSGSTTERSSPSSALGERQGGELYSSWPPGSNVKVPPPGSWKHGVPFEVQVSAHPWRAP